VIAPHGPPVLPVRPDRRDRDPNTLWDTRWHRPLDRSATLAARPAPRQSRADQQWLDLVEVLFGEGAEFGRVLAPGHLDEAIEQRLQPRIVGRFGECVVQRLDDRGRRVIRARESVDAAAHGIDAALPEGGSVRILRQPLFRRHREDSALSAVH
jgi:hypothetical protein